MAANPPSAFHESLDSLTVAEQRRVGTLLASVSTQTLLHSLARLCHDNADTKLIISALLGRVPFEHGRASTDPGADQEPVKPI